MKLKICDTDNVTELKINNKNKKTKDNSTIFSNTLNQPIEKSTNTSNASNTSLKDLTNEMKVEIKIGNPLIDSMPEGKKDEVLGAIGRLNKIFDLDILGHQDELFNKDGTFNIVKTLSLYGDKITPNEFSTLVNSINTLYDNGLISSQDYFYVLRWIIIQKEALKIKMYAFENNDISTGNLIYKSKLKK